MRTVNKELVTTRRQETSINIQILLFSRIQATKVELVNYINIVKFIVVTHVVKNTMPTLKLGQNTYLLQMLYSVLL